MRSRLEFGDDRQGRIITIVDGIDLRTLADGGWAGLKIDEARVVAQMLQGWEPLLEYRSKGRPRQSHGRTGRSGWFGYAPRPVPLRLPGGSEPEIDADALTVFRGRGGVPIAGCGCGGGIGCAALYARVASVDRGRQVTWQVDDRTFVFSREVYDPAMRRLLERVGEAPRLLDE